MIFFVVHHFEEIPVVMFGKSRGGTLMDEKTELEGADEGQGLFFFALEKHDVLNDESYWAVLVVLGGVSHVLRRIVAELEEPNGGSKEMEVTDVTEN